MRTGTVDPSTSPHPDVLQELRELAALRARLREALQETAHTLMWFATQQARGGMPANIWKNLDRLPSPRMKGLSPAFDLTNSLQRVERTLRQFDEAAANGVSQCLKGLTRTIELEVDKASQPPKKRRDPGLMRLLTDDRTGTLTLESAARVLRCGSFPIRIPALPSYVAGHVLFSELRLIRAQFAEFGSSTTVKRAPSAAYVAQGVAAVQAFIHMVQSRGDTCAAIARDLKRIVELRELVKGHRALERQKDPHNRELRELREGLRAQERFLFSRLAENFRAAGLSILGLRDRFQAAAAVADDAAEFKGPEGAPFDLRRLLVIGVTPVEPTTHRGHKEGRKRAIRFARTYKESLEKVCASVTTAGRESNAALERLKRLQGPDTPWTPSIVHTARYALLEARQSDQDQTADLFDFLQDPPLRSPDGEKRLKEALDASWQMHKAAFSDSHINWIDERSKVFAVAGTLLGDLHKAISEKEIALAFETASSKYKEHAKNIDEKLRGETRWVPQFAERLLFGCLTASSDRSDSLDLLSALWICDRMGHFWPEAREEETAMALQRLQRADGSFEPGRPPHKWVHGFVVPAPSAATIGVLASFLADRPGGASSGELRSEVWERRLARWEPLCIDGIKFLLGSRVGRFKKDRELSGWHSDRQPEDERIDLFTTCVAVRALSAMDDVMSKLINRRAFCGLEVKTPDAPKPKKLFAFDCRSNNPGQDEFPALITAQRASEALKFRSKGFARAEAPEAYSPRTTLYYGPPGTGKTFASEIIAGELQWPLVTVNPHDFLRDGDQFVAKVAAEIFQRLQFASNCCIIFDEFDQLIVDRNIQPTSPLAMVTSTMLPLLAESWKRAADNNCLIAFTTNYRAVLDAAAIRQGRIDQRSCVVYPDFGSRYLFLLDQLGQKLPAKRIVTLAKGMAMRTITDLLKVAKSEDPAAAARLLQPAVGSAHYADMFQKIAQLRGSSGQPNKTSSPAEDRARKGLRQEVERLIRSLSTITPGPTTFKGLKLPEDEPKSWVDFVRRLRRKGKR